MNKRKPPVAVYLERKVNGIYSSLSEEDDFRKAIDKGLDALKENMFAEKS